MLGARSGLVERLREEIGVESEVETEADPGNTDSPICSSTSSATSASPTPPRWSRTRSLVLLRSAGERGEAEAIGAHVAAWFTAAPSPSEIAIVLRDPARRGPLIARVLESYGVGVALEAELAVAATGVGGALAGSARGGARHRAGERRPALAARAVRGAPVGGRLARAQDQARPGTERRRRRWSSGSDGEDEAALRPAPAARRGLRRPRRGGRRDRDEDGAALP